MPITDTSIRNTKPAAKQQKLFDGGGLYLLITPTGGKWWRLKYRYGGREKLLSLGTYPDISLKDARLRREEIRKQIANGIDPSAARKHAKLDKLLKGTNTFDSVAEEWITKHSKKIAAVTTSKIRAMLKKDLLPWLGSRPITEITAPELLAVIRRIESRGANELAHQSLRVASKVFQYGIITGKALQSPAINLRGALEPTIAGHHAAITEPKKVGELLRAMNDYTGTFSVKCALLLSPMVFTRPGELRNAEWSEFNLDSAEWRIPSDRMKMRTPHIVPLSKQALSILQELYPLTGHGRYVFPSVRTSDRPMSENTINGALRRLGFSGDEMTGHGFRAMARTILDEVLGVRLDFIEHQLAHAVRDPNGRAYNRTAHLPERRKMMQSWADYLDKLKVGADVIPLREVV